MTEQIYIFCIVLLLLLVLFLSYKLYRFSVIILTFEASLEESLDILNERYEKITEISQIPVFFDSVEIRQVIAEIKASHEAVLRVANKLTSDSGIKSESQQKEND